MDTKTWRARIGQQVEVKVWLGDFAPGAFAIDVRDEHLNSVKPTASDSGLGYRTWLLPPLTGYYNCLVTLNRYQQAQTFVACSVDGAILPCFEFYGDPPINERPEGVFNEVPQGDPGEGTTSFHLFVAGA